MPTVPTINIGKALELRLSKGLSYDAIAVLLKCSKQGVYDALQKFKGIIDDASDGTLQAFQDHKSTVLNAVELQLIRSMTDPACVEKASLNNRAYAYQQIANQNRLESGKSTSNIGILAKLVMESEERLGTSAKSKTVQAIEAVDVCAPETGHDRPSKHASAEIEPDGGGVAAARLV